MDVGGGRKQPRGEELCIESPTVKPKTEQSNDDKLHHTLRATASESFAQTTTMLAVNNLAKYCKRAAIRRMKVKRDGN